MRRFLLFILIPILSGCFKDEPKLPQYYAKQEIDVTVDSVICFSGQEDFDNFIITCSTPFDSVHWYSGFQNQIFLGNVQPLALPNHPFGWEVIKCFGFTDSDTTSFLLQLNYCTRNLYIPTGFTPNGLDGINDTWFPLYYTTNDGLAYQPTSIHWEVRTLDGTRVFEADNDQPGWDGTYNNFRLPYGVYLYYIELNITGEDPIEYTGSFEMLG
ncbi:MAG: gliding motility-associated C-terminal domain-containing protein [Flavobacteriales bacterium]